MGDYFYATITDNISNWEIVKVTATSGTTFTVVRGQDNTTALAWSNGVVVEIRPVAQGLRDISNYTTQLAGTTTNSQGAGLVGYNNSLTYPANTVGAGIEKVYTDLASTAAGYGDALLMTELPAPGAVPLTQHWVNNMEVNVIKFGADPTGVADSTAAFNEAIQYLISLGVGTGGSASTNYIGGSLYMGAFGATFKILGTVLVPSGLIIDLQGASLVGGGVLTTSNTCFMSAAAIKGYVVGNQLTITTALLSGGAIPQNAIVSVPGYTSSVLTITAVSGVVLCGSVYGAALNSVCTLSASIGTIGSAGTPVTILVGTQGAAGTGSVGVAALVAGYSTAVTQTVPSYQGAIQIRNGNFTNFNCAISLHGCLDTCIFENIKYFNCLYSVYAVQCFYACFHNMMTRCASSTPFTTTATMGAYHFEGAVNVQEIDSLFCGGRLLGYEFWSSNLGITISIRNCSCEQGTAGFYFSGVSQKVSFRDCYIEGMSGLIFDFTHQGVSAPAYDVDIDDCFFNFCLGTIVNAIWAPYFRWGKGNVVQGTLPASILYLNDNTTSGGEVNIPDLQVYDNTAGGIGTGVIASGVMTVSGYTGNGIQVGTSFYGQNLTSLVTVSSLGTGTGGNGTYNVIGMTTASSGPIGISLMPSAPPLYTFNPASQTTKMSIKGRTLLNVYGTNTVEVAANAPGLTTSPISQNFFGYSNFIPGVIPFCSYFTYGTGTSRTLVIDTKIAATRPDGATADPYVMGIFSIIITANDNTYPSTTSALSGRFYGLNAIVDTPTSGYTVVASNFNGFIRLTVTGTAFASGAYVIAYATGIVKFIS